jgi:hypothetical protein
LMAMVGALVLARRAVRPASFRNTASTGTAP